jgi:iron complex outermembrane receptor protein
MKWFGERQNRIMKSVFAAMLIFSMTVVAAFGQDTDPAEVEGESSSAKKGAQNVLELDEMVVTATRTRKKISEAPASVDVVTGEEIEAQNIMAIDGAFDSVSGFNDRREDGIVGLVPMFSLRGIPGQNRTLVMLDGITLNEPRTGGAYFDGLAPGDVERIEVAKGPFSSLYGGYAMGGVINVITKMPEKREVTLKTGYGSSWNRGEAWDDMRTVYASGADKFGKLGLLLSYGGLATNGYPLNLNIQSSQPPAGITGWSATKSKDGRDQYLIGDKGDEKIWNDSFNLKAAYDVSDVSKVMMTFIRSRNEYEYDDPHAYLKDEEGDPVWSYNSVRETSFLATRGGKERNIYGLNFETAIADVQAKASLSFIDQAKSWYSSPGSSATKDDGPGTVSNSPSKSYNGDLQFTWPVFNSNVLTFGGAYRENEANSKNHTLSNWTDENSKTSLYYESKGKDRTISVFAEDEISILENLTAYIGFRQDWWETFDGYVNDVGKADYPKDYQSRDVSSFSPKAALVYKPFEKTILRASAGKAFRPPTIYELYYNFTSTSGTTTTANKDLEPEKNTSWDLGVRQELWKGATINATYFENYIEDLIYSMTVSSTLKERVNVGEAETKGFEIELEQRFDNGLRFYANIARTLSEVTENKANPDSVGKELTDLPDYVVNVGGIFTTGPFAVSLNGKYVGKRYGTDLNTDTTDNVYGSYDPYFVVDTKLGWQIASFANISFAVNNIFDEDYYYYYKAPGRSWFASLELKY